MRVPSVDAVPGVVRGGLRAARSEAGERVGQAAGQQARDRRVLHGRVEVAHDQPRQRRVEPAEERLGAAQPRAGRGAVPVRVRQAEAVAGAQVGEPAQGDDARDRVAPRARRRQPRRVGEPAHRPRLEPQAGGAVDDGAALAAAAAVVAAGAGAGVAGQPARQPALLEEAHLLQADDVGLEAGDGGCARAGPQRPAVPAVGLQAGADVEGGDAQRSGRPWPPAGLRVAVRAAGHPSVRVTWGSGCARTWCRLHCSAVCGAACRPCGRTRSRTPLSRCRWLCGPPARCARCSP